MALFFVGMLSMIVTLLNCFFKDILCFIDLLISKALTLKVKLEALVVKY